MAQEKTERLRVETFADHHVITPANPLRRVIRRADHRDTTQAGDIDAAVARAEQALAGLSGEFKTWMQVECDRLITAHAAMIAQGISKATRDELSGSTITITSLGPLGGIVTTPVINPPEVAIVGVNRIVERPMIRSGAIVPRKMMNLSSSFDHRVVDGQQAAEFVQALRRYLECPALLFVE